MLFPLMYVCMYVKAKQINNQMMWPAAENTLLWEIKNFSLQPTFEIVLYKTKSDFEKAEEQKPKSSTIFSLTDSELFHSLVQTCRQQ